MAYTEFTLWATPCEPLASALRAIMARLADSLDAVTFEPHVTLFCGPSAEVRALAICERIAERFAPLTLTADRLEHTESFTKTLFVQFDESEAAQAMFQFAKGYSEDSQYQLNPHLSLLYKTLPASARAELCQTLQAPMGAYLFDRIRLIETELPIEDEGPVRRWRTVLDAPLRG